MLGCVGVLGRLRRRGARAGAARHRVRCAGAAPAALGPRALGGLRQQQHPPVPVGGVGGVGWGGGGVGWGGGGVAAACAGSQACCQDALRCLLQASQWETSLISTQHSYSALCNHPLASSCSLKDSQLRGLSVSMDGVAAARRPYSCGTLAAPGSASVGDVLTTLAFEPALPERPLGPRRLLAGTASGEGWGWWGKQKARALRCCTMQCCITPATQADGDPEPAFALAALRRRAVHRQSGGAGSGGSPGGTRWRAARAGGACRLLRHRVCRRVAAPVGERPAGGIHGGGARGGGHRWAGQGKCAQQGVAVAARTCSVQPAC